MESSPTGSINGMEMSSLLSDGAEKGGDSPGGGRSMWGVVSKRSRAGSGSMSQSLLGGSGSGGSREDSERAGGGATAQAHPCVVCCTIFSAVSALCLLLLGFYVFADSEANFLILDAREDPSKRPSKGGHIIGAAVLYTMLTAACAYRWRMNTREAVFARLNN